MLATEHAQPVLRKVRPITEVHELELSSRCNLRCRYCPHPKLEREKGDMTMDVFMKAMDHVAYYCEQGTQGELALTGIGEAFLHPNFVEMVKLARRTLGPDRKMTLSTNGILVTDAIAQVMREYRVEVYVSLHRPEKAGPAIEVLKRHGVYVGHNSGFATQAMDWAGQLDWYVSAPTTNYCQYLVRGWGVIRQDGMLDACCMDAHSKFPLGSVSDKPGSWMTYILPLCATCNLRTPEELQ